VSLLLPKSAFPGWLRRSRIAKRPSASTCAEKDPKSLVMKPIWRLCSSGRGIAVMNIMNIIESNIIVLTKYEF
jgi:hypothetical protein